MKRNTKRMAVIGLVIGCLIIGSVGAFALAGGNAYQDFKSGVMQTALEQNMTVAAEVNVRQDGASILSGEAVMQIDADARYSSSQILVGGEKLDMENSEKDGVRISRVGDQITSVTGREHDDDDHDFENSPAVLKLAEMVADLLVGDVKTHFYGGSGVISVNLEGAQIPELLNVAASAAVEGMASKPGKASAEKDIFRNVIENITITQDVSITRISMESRLNDGYIEEIDVTITLTGKDKGGVSHEIEITCNAAISDIGSTAPAVVDTEGKEVTVKERYHR